MESNVQKMREALEMMISLFDKGVICTSYANTPEEMEQIDELYRKAKSALSLPILNCNVGTAEEQMRRFRSFCKMAGECSRCQFVDFLTTSRCFAHWAQMPYKAEEGCK